MLVVAVPGLCQATEKAEPLLIRPEACAVAEPDASYATPRGPNWLAPEAPPLSATTEACQLESVIAPVCPPAVADALVKFTVPKFARDSG